MEILPHALLCLLSGHSLWNGTFTEHPPFDVPDAKGNYLPLALGGFYMFLTMIILLQVGGPPQLGAQKTCTTLQKKKKKRNLSTDPEKELTGLR